MAHKRHKRKSKQGLAPGSLVFTGVQKMAQVGITVIHYNGTVYEEKKITHLPDIFELIDTFNGVVWINIDGIHDVETIESLCNYLQIHKLVTEDILNIDQRPKLDEYTDYVLTIMGVFQWEASHHSLDSEQISFLLKKNVLISFQEREGDFFEGVRNRLRESKGLIRTRTADYLLYALIDSITDHYFSVLELFGDRLDALEIELLEDPNSKILGKLHSVRQETLLLRRSVYPLREVVSRFEKLEPPLIHPDTRIFIRDLYDHSIQVIDLVETYRELSLSLLDLYMNSVSNRMNEIMKVLTIMASIFIPLTFIVGVYGMNFDHIPELHYRYGYFAVWAIMLIIFVSLLYFFKKKKWL